MSPAMTSNTEVILNGMTFYWSLFTAAVIIFAIPLLLFPGRIGRYLAGLHWGHIQDKHPFQKIRHVRSAATSASRWERIFENLSTWLTIAAFFELLALTVLLAVAILHGRSFLYELFGRGADDNDYGIASVNTVIIVTFIAKGISWVLWNYFSYMQKLFSAQVQQMLNIEQAVRNDMAMHAKTLREAGVIVPTESLIPLNWKDSGKQFPPRQPYQPTVTPPTVDEVEIKLEPRYVAEHARTGWFSKKLKKGDSK